MRFARNYFTIFLFLLFYKCLEAQNIPSPNYILPIQPGKPNFLAGTMGELRPNHFHAGIDIKTGGKEGLPVYASADGYISRINVSTSGYGNALYIMHPDGTTTVYAHLLQFSKDVATYVRSNQYKNKKFELELYPSKDEFPVKKGKQIALSGNSGSSGGPHLHYEIRDKMQNVLNPLKFGFTEIKDDIPPVVQKIALKTLDKNSRINNQFGRFEFTLTRQNNEYVVSSPISVQGVIGVEILTHDKLSGASNRNGVPCIELKLDNEKVFYSNLTTFSFAESRNILIHTDYQIKKRTGEDFQKLYIDDGNELMFYDTNEHLGKIKIFDDRAHVATVELWDAYDNKTNVKFILKGATPQSSIARTNFVNTQDKVEVLQNTMLISKNFTNMKSKYIIIYSSGSKNQVEPDYEINSTGFYLWDLRVSLPDSIDTGSEIIKTGFSQSIPSDKEFIYSNKHIDITFPAQSLFDTLFIRVNYETDETGKREFFKIHEDIVPIKKNISIVLKPSQPVPAADKEKTHVYSVNKFGKYDYTGGAWLENEIRFSTRNFGTFVILKDSIAPVIKPLVKNKEVISFIITDALSGVKEYAASLNGEWLLMNYDKKRNLIWSEKPYDTYFLTGDFQLIIKDNAGNESVYTAKL